MVASRRAPYNAPVNLLSPPFIELSAEDQSAAANGALLTASERLRRETSYALDWLQLQRVTRQQGRLSDQPSAWRQATVHSLDSLLRLWHDAARRRHADIPLLLSAAQWRLLVRDCAPEPDLAHLAPLVEDAWQQQHAWLFDETDAAFGYTENGRLYRAWARRLRRALLDTGAITQAQLASHPAVIEAGANGGATRWLGFDLLTRQQQALREALAENHAPATLVTAELTGAAASNGEVRGFATAQQELAAAIDWAAARLADAPGARVGIVVPDLNRRQSEVRRLLRQRLPADASGQRYNVGGGLPLAEHPLIASALEWLEAIARPQPAARLQALLRDPHLPAFNAPAPLPANLPGLLRLDDLPHEHRSSALAAALRELGAAPDAQPLAAHWQWAARWLHRADWHSAREDSAGYQAMDRFQELLLGDTAGALGQPVAWPQALAALRACAAGSLFAEQTDPAPLQILGQLEALELRFDQLWLTGLGDAEWPHNAQRNPLLPLALLTRAGVPRRDPPTELAFAQRWLQRMAQAAPAVVASFATSEEQSARNADDLPQGKSPLLRGWHDVPSATLRPDAAEETPPVGELETLADTLGPAPAPGSLAGGANRLAEQAKCPLRSWAIHSLALREPNAPHSLPDPLDQGIALHEAAEALFARITDSDQLQALSNDAAAAHCLDAATTAVERRLQRFPESLRRNEIRRLARRLEELLAVERERPETFRVRSREQDTEVQVAGATFRVRLDRLDESDSGTSVIDYKSGSVKLGDLRTDRLLAPQLPLYLCTDPDATRALYARVPTDSAQKVELLGLAADDQPTFRRIEAVDDWQAQRTRWQEQLDTLAGEILAGEARAEPSDPDFCKRCHLRSLCRLHLHDD